MKKIIITGTSKGIGRSTALYLLKKKFKIIGISRSHTIKHRNYFPLTHDLNRLSEYKEKIEHFLKDHKDISAVVSNAGNGIFKKLENFSSKQIQEYFNLNLIAHILIAKMIVPIFKKQKRGDFIFLGSEASIDAGKMATLYATAKHGLSGFVKSLRAECNTSNIRVTIINPGMVRSSFFKNLNFQPGEKNENAINKNDIAELISFLLQTNKHVNYSEINLKPIKKNIQFNN